MVFTTGRVSETPMNILLHDDRVLKNLDAIDKALDDEKKLVLELIRDVYH